MIESIDSILGALRTEAAHKMFCDLASCPVLSHGSADKMMGTAISSRCEDSADNFKGNSEAQVLL